jgi:gas vesicle protein GvpL/GvpF
VIELYAVTDSRAPDPPAPLHAVPAGGLAVVVGPAQDAQDVSPEALWRHEEIVEGLMSDRDLLPVRYGTRFPSEEDAARVIAERCEPLAAALDRVRGAVELSVRVVLPGSSSEAARESARRAVQEPLGALARARSERAPQAPDELLRAAYLVELGAVATFAALVARLEADLPELRLLCTGPWPPYSFTEA